MENRIMLDYAKKEGPHIWIGSKPTYDWDSVEMLNSSNYRVSDSHHHKYKVVWFYETLLDDVGNLGWKIVLDELIRLLCEDGYLIIRMRDNRVPSGPFLKKLLGRHIGVEAEVEYEQRDKDSDIWTFIFRIKRLHIEKYLANDWTFAILTLGNKVNNVVRFLKSIREYEPNHDSEIIIVGPENTQYNEYNVKYIGLEQFRDGQYSEISKKKNAIIDAASNSNLMIVHDRFILAPNFFEGFEKWGYDYDFITVSQFTEDGYGYPGYAATLDYMRLSGQIWVQELRHLYDNQFLNGGLIIMKTHMAKELKFNHLLMWAQMEDVELAQVFMEHGLIPRVNFISTAIVLEVSKDYFKSWVMESDLAVPGRDYGKTKRSPWKFNLVHKITKRVPSWLKRNWLYKKVKGIYWAGREL